jgi:MFS family permease
VATQDTGSTGAATAKVNLGRKSALAGFLGTALEYYDFFIYGMAASLAFGDVFFGGGKAALLASFATFGVSYCARPFGGIILGHFGDKIGRRQVLMFTILLMGVSTFIIGCLPTFAQVGWVAPVLLVFLRLCQGFSAGAEVAGTSTLTMENSPANRRGFYSSFTITGCNLGIVMANAIFLPIQTLPEEARLSWGWRIPFLASAIITVVAYLVRRVLVEPETFVAVKKEKKVAKLPLGELLRTDWQNVVRCVLMILYTASNTAVTVWALAFATKQVGVASSTMLWAVIGANLLGMAVQPLGALLSDRIGRRPVFIFGCVGIGPAFFLYMHLITTGNAVSIFFGALLVTGFFYSTCNGIYQSFFPELFHVKVRYSGVALSLQLGLLVAGFTPMIASALVPAESLNWTPLAIFMTAICLLSAAAAITAKETFKTPLAEMGVKKDKVQKAA